MRSLVRFFLFLLVPFLVSVAVFKFMTRAFLTPMDAADTTPVFFEIASGRSFRAIAHDLEAQGLVRYWWSVEALGRLRRDSSVINTGEYELSRAMNTVEVLQKLASGETFKRRVTIKEGMSIWAIGAMVEDAGLLSRAEFEKALVDPQLLTFLGVNAPSFEGYLFPETYFFSKPVTTKIILQKMVEQGKQLWGDRYQRRAEVMGLSRHEVLTIASIVEKETGIVTEQPIIASVIQNRLKQGMKLQVDPTVIYGIPNFNGNLTKEDLERPTPYNTYTNYGLPPGPIGNPGRGAIDSTLFPADTKFLYFVADGTGGHYFSATLAEHNEAVRRFQLR